MVSNSCKDRWGFSSCYCLQGRIVMIFELPAYLLFFIWTCPLDHSVSGELGHLVVNFHDNSDSTSWNPLPKLQTHRPLESPPTDSRG